MRLFYNYYIICFDFPFWFNSGVLELQLLANVWILKGQQCQWMVGLDNVLHLVYKHAYSIYIVVYNNMQTQIQKIYTTDTNKHTHVHRLVLNKQTQSSPKRAHIHINTRQHTSLYINIQTCTQFNNVYFRLKNMPCKLPGQHLSIFIYFPLFVFVIHPHCF